jgi:hypothetical protein
MAKIEPPTTRQTAIETLREAFLAREERMDDPRGDGSCDDAQAPDGYDYVDLADDVRAFFDAVDGSSSQKHSAGAGPLIIVGQETSFGIMWGVMGPDGAPPFQLWFECAHAVDEAADILARRAELAS